MNENPTAAEIMEEVRQGLSDTSLSDATKAQREQQAGLQSNLRQAHAHASVMGRCGGSLRGTCCKLLAPIARPIIEQLDILHTAVIRSLEQLSGTQSDTRTRLADLEKRIATLESKEHSQESK